jgi:hypothetical protein
MGPQRRLARTDKPEQLFVHVGVLIFAPIPAAALDSPSDNLIDHDTHQLLPFSLSCLAQGKRKVFFSSLCAAFGVGEGGGGPWVPVLTKES